MALAEPVDLPAVSVIRRTVMPYATNGDVRLYWEAKGAGIPVLLVMGATYSSRIWYPVIDTFAEKHRVIWFDNRGVGRSQEVRTGRSSFRDTFAITYSVDITSS
jgi:pimeloyl-ACP methyl ester carboxylesterase